MQWIKSRFDAEKEEFERTVLEFDSARSRLKTNMILLKREYIKAKMVSLSPSDWKKMQNTDSWTTTTLEKIEKAIEDNGEPRDVSRIINQFTFKKVECPIAIRLNSGDLYLVAGNTRLMVAKMLNVRPKIIIIETDW